MTSSVAERRHRGGRLGTTGYIGLLVGVLSALYLVNRSGAAQGSQPAPAQPSKPTERIDVEQGVAFPRDI